MERLEMKSCFLTEDEVSNLLIDVWQALKLAPKKQIFYSYDIESGQLIATEKPTTCTITLKD